jgi:glycosyltransferase involved in cell wall biosynthesis
MRLSIITINLNNRDGLQRTIDSVVSQTFHDFEWIVIDGGSTDGSKELIEQYANHFAYWVSEPDKGIYNAMNKGVKVAKGEYSLFLNSGDTLMDSSVLDNVFKNFISADIIYGNLIFLKREGENETKYYSDKLSVYDIYNNSLPHPSTFIKTNLLRKTPYDEQLQIIADWKFFLQKALEKVEFYHINIIISCFDMSGISFTNPKLLLREREKVKKNTIPSCIINEFEKLDELVFNQPDAQMKELMSLRAKNKTYHKIVTIVLVCFKAFEKVRFCKCME